MRPLVQFNYVVDGLLWDNILLSDGFPGNFWTKEIMKIRQNVFFFFFFHVKSTRLGERQGCIY
jgi:hypothetical protein